MQLVNPAHQTQVGLADRRGLVVHRAATDVQRLSLPGYGEGVVSVYRGFGLSSSCAQQSRLGERAF